jgi:hypothetical protein
MKGASDTNRDRKNIRKKKRPERVSFSFEDPTPEN